MNFKSFCSFTRKLFLLILLPGSLCLRDVDIIIPEAAERGKPITIRCLYDLENEDLYQVKWYRGKKEFCRYEPMEVPPLKIFPIPGIQVDREGTDAKQLTISAATSTAQGRYTCEVSADGPSFLTVQLHGFMYVVDLPKTYPDLIWQQRRLYRPGMKIKAKCISYDSMPPANLSFYINNVPALSEHVWERVSGGVNGSLWTAYSTLEFLVRKHHIIELKIRIRCAATIYSIFYKSHEKSAEAEITRTTIAPFIWPEDRTTPHPTKRISQNIITSKISTIAKFLSFIAILVLYSIMLYCVAFIARLMNLPVASSLMSANTEFGSWLLERLEESRELVEDMLNSTYRLWRAYFDRILIYKGIVSKFLVYN